ncbi:CBS domain-containing protein [Streptomyces sp. ALB3]|uniref:CBS domain-containing protein n=1 Tax=Streptomyces sp. ALB3 TaxID=3374278 RepID=UPI0037AA0DB9
MTPVQTQLLVTGADPAHRPVTEAMDAAGPQVCDDMSVEVALAVMAAARTGRLVVCDQDGRRTGLVTLAELAAVRDGHAYTDRVRLRDLLVDHRSLTSPVTGGAGAGQATRHLRLGSRPVAAGRGGAPGAPGLSR